MDQDYKDLSDALWKAYTIYVSAGCTHAAFKRHIWPVIKMARIETNRKQLNETSKS